MLLTSEGLHILCSCHLHPNFTILIQHGESKFPRFIFFIFIFIFNGG